MKASDWIDVKDRLPITHKDELLAKYSDEVLICLNGCEPAIAKLVIKKYEKDSFWISISGYEYPIGLVTHWQPIVLPKKEKK
jgi:hypothetical protein